MRIDPKAPRLQQGVEGAQIKSRRILSAPHTVHCLGSGHHNLDDSATRQGKARPAVHALNPDSTS